MKQLHAWLLILAATTVLPGTICGPAPENPEPCEMDPLGCGEQAELKIDPTCTRTDPLIVKIGDGASTYMSFTDSHEPEIQYGFQGGQHFYLGVEIENPEFDSPGLEITFEVRGSLGCALETPADMCTDWMSFAMRSLVVTDPALLKTSGEHLTTTGYVTVLESDPWWWAEGQAGRIEITAQVRDACDRRGNATFSYLYGPNNPGTTSDTSDGTDTGTGTGTG